MTELLARYGSLLVTATAETLYMTLISTACAYLLGLPLGVLLTITSKGGILETPRFNAAFGWVIDMLRSLPFMILMFFVI
ncbi:MAG: methionine ABC transporter permease, partial [Pygmaiobacter massiliensis]